MGYFMLNFWNPVIAIGYYLLFIIHNFRHEARQIYTYIGDVCVSVNPYTNLDIYGSEYVNQYKGEECVVCGNLLCSYVMQIVPVYNRPSQKTLLTQFLNEMWIKMAIKWKLLNALNLRCFMHIECPIWIELPIYRTY